MTGLLLKDGTITMTSQGGEDGTLGPAVGSAVTLCINSMRIVQTREVVDASCGQDSVPINRVSKLNWEVTIEMPLELGGTFAASLQTNSLVSFTATFPGYVVEGAGIITSITASINNPSTLELTIVPYGSVLTVTAS